MSRSRPIGTRIHAALATALLVHRAWRLQRRIATVPVIDSSLRLTNAGITAAGALRGRESRRHRRLAMVHTQRALTRSRRIGATRAATDPRVRAQIDRARRHAAAAVRPSDHTKRNRVLAATALAAGLTAGGAAVTAARAQRGTAGSFATVPPDVPDQADAAS